MAGTPGPNLGLVSGFGHGANGWDTDMDNNLALLDALVNTTVVNMTTKAPPPNPAPGDRYVIAAGATGDWAGKDNQLAVFVKGVFVFYNPKVGTRVYDLSTKLFHYFDADGWALEPAGAAGGGGGGLADAPNDGKAYVRQGGAWVALASAGGGGGSTPKLQVVQSAIGGNGAFAFPLAPIEGNVLVAFTVGNFIRPSLESDSWQRLIPTQGFTAATGSHVCPGMFWRPVAANETAAIAVTSDADMTIAYEISGIASSDFLAAVEGLDLQDNPNTAPAPLVSQGDSTLAIVFAGQRAGNASSTFGPFWKNYISANPGRQGASAYTGAIPAQTSLSEAVTIDPAASDISYGMILLKS